MTWGASFPDDLGRIIPWPNGAPEPQNEVVQLQPVHGAVSVHPESSTCRTCCCQAGTYQDTNTISFLR